MNLKLRRSLLGLLGGFAACGAFFGLSNIDGWDIKKVDAAEMLPDGYTRLESLDQVETGDSFVLGIADENGVTEAFSFGTSSWGKMSTNPDDWKQWTIHLQGDGSFKASTLIDDKEYYLTVPTSNDWELSDNANGNNTGLVLGTTTSPNKDADNRPYAIANKNVTSRSLRKNGTSGIRSYNNTTTGSLVFFYEFASLPALTELKITGDFKTEYLEGDNLNLDGMVVTAYFEDGTNQVLDSSDYTVSPDTTSSLKSSDVEFVVTYQYAGQSHTATHPISVQTRSLISIDVTTLPTNVNYVVGQELDSTGIVVEGTFEGDYVSDVTSDCTFNPTVFDEAGVQDVTVTHTPTGISTKFEVTVVDKAVKSLSLTGKTTAFESGSTFTLGDDAVLTARWNDGSEEVLTLATPDVTVELLPNIDSKPGTGRVIDESYVMEVSDDGSYVSVGYQGVYANKYQISVREVLDVSEGTFRLVSNVEDIAVGDIVVIAGLKSGTYYAMSTKQTDNNRGITPISILDDEFSVGDNSEVEVITLEAGSSEGSYALGVLGGYLDVSSGSKNRLTTTSQIDEQTSWTITFSGSHAHITSVAYEKRQIMINGQSGSNTDVMAAYESSQLPVSLYKFEKADADSEAVKDFVDTYMHMSDYGDSNQGLCAGEDGYYAKAKEALLKLSDLQIELFKTSDEFTAAHDRYLAWARANGDTDPYGETGVSGIVLSPSADVPETSIVLSSVFGLGLVAVVAGGVFIVKRRRESNQ